MRDLATVSRMGDDARRERERRDLEDRADSRVDCTRDAGHQGPCNGYPRLDAGLHCYTMRKGDHHAYGSKVHVPYSGELEPGWLGRVKAEVNRIATLEARITDLEAENARLATRVNELIAMTSTDH